jgi:hypothetical protein
MNNKQDVKDYNILLRIIIFLCSILVYSCQSNIELDQKAYNNFSINGDSLTPHILIGDLMIGDSNYCYKIQLGDTIRLKSMAIHSSGQWVVGGKNYDTKDLEIKAVNSGILMVKKINESGMIIASKCIYVRPADEKGSLLKDPGSKEVRSDNFKSQVIDCKKLYFTNSRFDATISGLPNGDYEVILLENEQIKLYKLNSKNEEANFKLAQSYPIRPNIKIKSLTSLQNKKIKCVF